MSLSSRDMLFNSVVENINDYLKTNTRSEHQAPIFEVRNNKQFPELNGRTFMGGLAKPPKNVEEEGLIGVALIELFPLLGPDDVLVQFIAHCSNKVPPNILGIEKQPTFNLTISSSMELFNLLHNYLINWKEEQGYKQTLNKTIH